MRIFQKEPAAEYGGSLPNVGRHLEDIPDSRGILLIDIETTGLRPQSSALYMIGCLYPAPDAAKEGAARITQFFADRSGEEAALLSAFSAFLTSSAPERFHTLLHFNGNRFDLPYLRYKYRQYGLADPLQALASVDLYRLIAPWKRALGLPDCKQKTIEAFLGIRRDDLYGGGELIPVYQAYLAQPGDEALQLLTLHNEEDLTGMLRLLPMLEYVGFFRTLRSFRGGHGHPEDTAARGGQTDSAGREAAGGAPVSPPHDMQTDSADRGTAGDALLPRVADVSVRSYTAYDQSPQKELYLRLVFSSPFPAPFSCNADGIFLQAQGNDALLRIPLFTGELKYFYRDYKNYYYLPKEDTAIHRSVAFFVDPAFRRPAAAATCYTRKRGVFAPEWEALVTPVFQKAYADRQRFFLLDDKTMENGTVMRQYALLALSRLIRSVS